MESAVLERPGAIVAGKYRIEKPLARGGVGTVWIARHVQLQHLVAVKFLDPKVASSPQVRTRFEREARAAAHLKTPHVVQVFDYGIQSDTPYLVMELLEGETLHARLRRETRIGMVDTFGILAQIGKGLRRAHEIGFVHRDLKPANIFLTRPHESEDSEAIVKILDFGIAKETGGEVVGESTRTGELVGSPHYMSPEQIRGEREVDARSDLWALGVIVYRVLTGYLPFPGEVLTAVITKIVVDPIPSAVQYLPGAPASLESFFETALARDKAKRFQTVGDLVRAFGEVAAEASGMSSAQLFGPGSAPSRQAFGSIPDFGTPSGLTSSIPGRSSPIPGRPGSIPGSSTPPPGSLPPPVAPPRAVPGGATLQAATPPPRASSPGASMSAAVPPPRPPQGSVSVSSPPPQTPPPGAAVNVAKPPPRPPQAPAAVPVAKPPPRPPQAGIAVAKPPPRPPQAAAPLPSTPPPSGPTFLSAGVTPRSAEEPIAPQGAPMALPEEPISLHDEPISLQGAPISLPEEPISLHDEPISLQGEPISLRDEAVAAQGAPVASAGEPRSFPVESATVVGTPLFSPGALLALPDEPLTVPRMPAQAPTSDASLSVSSPPSGPAERPSTATRAASPPPRKSLWIVAAAAGVLVLLLVGFGALRSRAPASATSSIAPPAPSPTLSLPTTKPEPTAAPRPTEAETAPPSPAPTESAALAPPSTSDGPARPAPPATSAKPPAGARPRPPAGKKPIDTID